MVEEAGAELAPLQSGSYFARHWRGDLSLARSWWIGGVLINGLAVGMLFAIAAQVTILLFDRNRGVAVVLLLLQIVLTIGAYVWAVVGVWRSAGKHPGSRFWPIVARVMIVLGVLVSIANVARSADALACYLSESCSLHIGR